MQSAKAGGTVHFEMLTRWVEWAVRPSEGADPESHFRTELGVVFGSFQLLALFALGLVEFAWGTPAIGWIFMISALLLLTIVVRLRAGLNPRLAVTCLLSVLFATDFVINIASGGLALGANLALPTLALFAALMSSGRMALFWIALILIHVIGMSQLRDSGIDFPIKPSSQWVASATERVPFVFSVASGFVGWLIRNAMLRFRRQLVETREAEREARSVQAAVTAQLADFAQIAADGFWETDADLKLSYASPSFFRMIGLPPDECLGLTPEQVFRKRFPESRFDPDHMQPMRNRDAHVVQTLRSADANGQPLWLRSEGKPRLDSAGNFAGYRGVFHDITDEQNAQRALRESEQRLRMITDNLPVLISYIDANRIFQFNNETYARWLKRPLTEITGKRVSDVFVPETYALIEPNLSRALKGERLTFDIAPDGSGGRDRHIQVTYVPDKRSEGEVRGVYGLIHDITNVRAVEAELRQMSEFDALTGLANRKRLGDAMTEAIARSDRSGHLMALLFLDLDKFKEINDSLGHKGGDLVLQEFARRLQTSVRQTDTVCRLAGDEFIVVLEMLHTADEARHVAEKILGAMKPAFSILGHTRTLSASIGVAVRREGETEGEALLRRADAALYSAKEDGRGRVSVSS